MQTVPCLSMARPSLLSIRLPLAESLLMVIPGEAFLVTVAAAMLSVTLLSWMLSFILAFPFII